MKTRLRSLQVRLNNSIECAKEKFYNKIADKLNETQKNAKAYWSLKSDSRHFKKCHFDMNLSKIIDLRQLITFDSFLINGCKEMGPRMAHFWNFCANALIRVRLWSYGFSTSQYGLTLLDLSSNIPC